MPMPGGTILGGEETEGKEAEHATAPRTGDMGLKMDMWRS
jgi:hypothetical protein